MAKKPDVEAITKTTNRTGADVVVLKDRSDQSHSWYQAYCHGCTEISRHYPVLPQATSWAQTHATVCNFG